MNFVVAVKADSEAAEVMEPAEGPFRDPSKDAKAASMFLIPFGKVWFDASFAKLFSMRLGVIGSIGINLILMILRMAGFPTDGRNTVDQWKKLSHIMSVCSRQCITQRNAIGVRQDMMFAAGFASIRWIWACFLASSHGPYRRTIDCRSRPVDQISCSQVIEQFVVQVTRKPDSCY